MPCSAKTPRLRPDQIAALAPQVPAWRVDGDRRLLRTFRFADFAGAMALANRVADVAETEGHHPDLHVHWGRLEVEVTTHAIKGLSENDFILAAKVDALVGV